MNQKSIILGLLAWINFSLILFSQADFLTLRNDNVRSDYSLELSKLFNLIINQEEIPDSLLIFSCPMNQNEYRILYKFTDPDTSKLINEAYNERQNLLVEKLSEGRVEFLIRQMIMSVFIDGEEAEDFFDGLEYYYKLHPDSFCNAYKKLITIDKVEKYYRMRTLNIGCLNNE